MKINRSFCLGFAALTVGIFSPLLCMLLASGLSDALHCTVNEARAHPCSLAGIDIGGLLHVLGMMGWLMLLAIPFMALSVLGWVLLLLYAIGRVVWRWFRRDDPSGPLGPAGSSTDETLNRR